LQYLVKIFATFFECNGYGNITRHFSRREGPWHAHEGFVGGVAHAVAPAEFSVGFANFVMETNKTYLFLFVAILISLAPVDIAIAKCPYKPYTIIGVVRNAKTNQYINGAKLFFFFDDQQSTLANGYETRYPDFFTTNQQGAFRAKAFFPTYSGWLFSDLCGKKPKRLMVIVTAEGFTTKRLAYKLDGLIGDDKTINLPSISINK
jgi:hypothetical protein